MRPFFSYTGSKWTMAPRYGAPVHPLVIEPFAGSACYATRHNAEKAILFDKSKYVIEVWKYLISASYSEIMNLPTEFDSISDLQLPQGAKYLIGFWITKGSSVPHNRRTVWGKQYANDIDCKVWGEPAKRRIASQVERIRSWEAHLLDYRECPDIQATWFIDPPYQEIGKVCYKNSVIDYRELSNFVKRRKGQVICCEGSKANYLHLADARGMFGKYRTGKSPEFVYLQG